MNKKISLIGFLLVLVFPLYAWELSPETEAVSLQKELESLYQLEEPLNVDISLIEPIKKVKPKQNSNVLKKTFVPLTNNERALSNYQNAFKFFNGHNIPEAIKILNKNLVQYPEHSMSRLGLAHIYILLKKIEEAHTLISEGLAYEPQNTDYMFKMASIYEKKGEYESALNMLKKVPAIMQNHKNYLLLLGLVYQELKQNQLAKQPYIRLVQLEPSNIAGWLGLALSFESNEEWTEALECYKQAQSKNSQSHEVIEFINYRLQILQSKQS